MMEKMFGNKENASMQTSWPKQRQLLLQLLHQRGHRQRECHHLRLDRLLPGQIRRVVRQLALHQHNQLRRLGLHLHNLSSQQGRRLHNL